MDFIKNFEIILRELPMGYNLYTKFISKMSFQKSSQIYFIKSQFFPYHHNQIFRIFPSSNLNPISSKFLESSKQGENYEIETMIAKRKLHNTLSCATCLN
jgi:hypothetical protein